MFPNPYIIGGVAVVGLLGITTILGLLWRLEVVANERDVLRTEVAVAIKAADDLQRQISINDEILRQLRENRAAIRQAGAQFDRDLEDVADDPDVQEFLSTPVPDSVDGLLWPSESAEVSSGNTPD